MSLQQIYGATSLIHYLVSTYFSHLSSVLIVYDSKNLYGNSMQQQYLDNVQQAFENQSKNGNLIGLQWINVEHLNKSGADFSEQILNTVDFAVVEGFITILGNTSRFLHSRYYATRYSTLRLKDKIYLFLCESHENPKKILATEILQFYPHHLMVVPETTYPECNDDHNKEQGNENTTTQKTTKNQNIKQTFVNRKTTSNNLKVTNVTMTIVVDASISATPSKTDSFAYFFHTNKNNRNKYKYHYINFELWTQQYVGVDDNLNAVHLDTYIGSNGTFAKNINLYPNKILNLQQRPVRVGTLTYVPYLKTGYVPPGQGDVDSINSKSLSNIVQFIGSEAELIKSFCVIHNCHLRVKPYAPDNWGTIYENGSSEGMLGDLYNQQTEIAIGCVYNWFNDITETSQFIARSAVTILGPGPSQYPRWRTATMPFSNGLWIFLVFTIVVCSMVFHSMKLALHHFEYSYGAKQIKYQKTSSLERSMLDMYAVFIQQPSADTILHHIATRIFLAFLLSATITLENTYSGQLKSLLTMPLFSEPVDTMHKWSLTGWKWAAPSIIWIYSVENSDIAKEQRLAKHFEVRNHEFLYNATFRDDYGLGIERVYSGAFSFGNYITKTALENKIIPEDDLYFDWTRAVAIRGWPIMPLLDIHILFCLETGLYIHWEKQMSYYSLDRQVQDILIELSSGSKPKPPPQKLSIEHISGPLFILLFGYLLAFSILMVELFGRHVKWNFGTVVTHSYLFGKFFFKKG